MSLQKAFAWTFLVAFVVFSVPYGLYIASRTNLLRGIKTGLLAGFLFASVGTILVMVLYLLVKSIKPIATQIQQERTVVLKGELNRVFSWCAGYLKAAPYVKDVVVSSDRGAIDARTKMSLRSFGENITVSCTSLSGGSVRVQVKSEPHIRTTIVDYGKNLRNVEDIAKALQREFGTQA